MFQLLRPMKLLTLSVLIMGWLAMGFGIELDSTTINTGTTEYSSRMAMTAWTKRKHIPPMA